jgi:hypothetical protein
LLRELVTDLCGLAGAALVGYGLWQIGEPLAWLWAGVCLLTVTVARVRGE